MKGEADFTVAELGQVITTRVSLGIGLGLLIGNRLSQEQRRSVGRALLLVGAINAAVLGLEVFGRPRAFHLELGPRKGLGRSEPSEKAA